MSSKLEKAVAVLGLSAIAATGTAMFFSAIKADLRMGNRPSIKVMTAPQLPNSISAKATLYDTNADQVPDSAYVQEVVCTNIGMGCPMNSYWRAASSEEKEAFKGKLQSPSERTRGYIGTF